MVFFPVAGRRKLRIRSHVNGIISNPDTVDVGGFRSGLIVISIRNPWQCTISWQSRISLSMIVTFKSDSKGKGSLPC